jgi:pyrimidine operon attenuation protein / uracil phosphoribosyltransferase
MNASLPDPEELVRALAERMKGAVSAQAGIVGIYTGGAWVAERLHRALGSSVPLGMLAVTLHRDDFGRIGLHRESRRSQIPFAVDGREVILVDDVLHTGRTIRAALNELFDFGRPAAVRLAVLADREGRELPVCGDFVGARVDVPQDEQLVLSNENGKLAFTRVQRVKRP